MPGMAQARPRLRGMPHRSCVLALLTAVRPACAVPQKRKRQVAGAPDATPNGRRARARTSDVGENMDANGHGDGEDSEVYMGDAGVK